VTSPANVGASDLWAAVHQEVQQQLAPLDADVRRRLPHVRATPGRTSGEQFFLFSYYTFSAPDSSVDPVVAGITFRPANGGATVEADISGETSGDCVFSLPSKTVSVANDDLIAVAQQLAQKLRAAVESVVTALLDPNRHVR
jgi:hypothetical protein